MYQRGKLFTVQDGNAFSADDTASKEFDWAVFAANIARIDDLSFGCSETDPGSTATLVDEHTGVEPHNGAWRASTPGTFPVGVLGHYAFDTGLSQVLFVVNVLAGFVPMTKAIDGGVLPGALTFIGDQHTELAPGTPNYDLLGVRTTGGVTTWGAVSQDRVAPGGLPCAGRASILTRLLFDSGRPESRAFFGEHVQETDAAGVFYRVPYDRALTRLPVVHATMSDSTDRLRPVVTSTTLTHVIVRLYKDDVPLSVSLTHSRLQLTGFAELLVEE